MRTSLPPWLLEVVERVGPKVEKLVATTFLAEDLRCRNNRGPHYSGVFGQDGQNKNVRFLLFDEVLALTFCRPLVALAFTKANRARRTTPTPFVHFGTRT